MFLGCYTYYEGEKYPERALINNQEVKEIDELKENTTESWLCTVDGQIKHLNINS